LSTKILAVPVAAPDTTPAAKRPYLPNGTKHISPCQADNMVEAAKFARETGFPLYCHATIHWGQTNAGNDIDGHRFARVREGFRKQLHRRGIQFKAVWAREAPHESPHVHMIFYLPSKWLRDDTRLAEIERGLKRLVDRHGGGIWGDFTVRFTQRNGYPGYLIKGGTPEVWRKYRVKRGDWRKSQGIIFGKRCGTTPNIGPQARERWWG